MEWDRAKETSLWLKETETKIKICVSVSAKPKPKSWFLVSVSARPKFLILPKFRPKFLIYLKSGRNSLYSRKQSQKFLKYYENLAPKFSTYASDCQVLFPEGYYYFFEEYITSGNPFHKIDIFIKSWDFSESSTRRSYVPAILVHQRLTGEKGSGKTKRITLETYVR